MVSQVHTIEYSHTRAITVGQFKQLLEESGLGARRPIDNERCLDGMLAGADVVVTAWAGGRLIGIARSMTDFHYACYLSDLAVDRNHQHRGVGKRLLAETQNALEAGCKLILLAAPDANAYYPKLGFINNDRCWVRET